MFRAEQHPVTARRSSLLTAQAAAAAVVVFLALRLAGQDLQVAARGDPRSVPLGAVVLAAAAGGLAAHLLAALARRNARPRRTFVTAVVTGLALSAVPPVVAATALPTVVWLLVLHLVVAAVLVPPLARALPSHRSVLRRDAAAPEGRIGARR